MAGVATRTRALFSRVDEPSKPSPPELAPMASDPSTADRILEMLRAAAGSVRGPDIARTLSISRAAVWKHVRKLESLGYRIASDNPGGYRLEEASDRMLSNEIQRHLTARRIGRLVHHFDSIDSTNRHAMALARDGAAEGEVVIAESQTAGRGRLGRSFFSPSGVSFYGSMILRPAIPPGRAPQITLVAGLAVAQAIEAHARVRPALKWPNDVWLEDRKVAGILTEMESEADRVLHVVCGPGVNLNTPAEAFPEELRGIATSILASTGRRVDRPAFAATLFDRFEALYDEFLAGGLERLRERWDAYSMLTGRRVVVEGAGAPVEGEVLGLDADGALRLRGANGETSRAIAGDVTLRK